MITLTFCVILMPVLNNEYGKNNMKCTSCGIGTLSSAYLESLLPCYQCSHCGGNLFMMRDYLRWKDNNPELDSNSDSTSVELQETEKAMICPKSDGLMTKYRIASDTDHRLDLSASIGAVWLDKGEWELLKQKGLLGSVNTIFTDHWQHEIRSQESADILSSMYQRKFGDHYEKIKSFRELVNQMDSKSEVIAYLLADDPYQP